MSDSVLITRASLYIQVEVECPHCKSYIDLLTPEDTGGEYLNDDGDVLSRVFPENLPWYDEEFTFEDVTCSNCKKTFNVEGCDW